MKMSDVRPGMRLRATLGVRELITVRAITERGFRYSIDRPRALIPRWGMTMLADGHEHFGINGEALFERVPAWCCQRCGAEIGYIGRAFQRAFGKYYCRFMRRMGGGCIGGRRGREG